MENNYLAHYGIKGMHWGVRRFQNSDGSRTPAGREREREKYGSGNGGNGNRGSSSNSLAKSRRKYENARAAENKHYKEWISRARKKDLTEEEGEAYDRKADALNDKKKQARKEYRDTLRAINKEAAAKYREARKTENSAYKEWISRARKKDLTEEEGDAYDKITDEAFEKKQAAKKEYIDSLREIISDRVRLG